MDQKYIDANTDLSKLLDHDDDWMWNSHMAFRLQAEYQVSITWYDTIMLAQAFPCAKTVFVYLREHPDRGTALRYGIVKAVTERLLSEKVYAAINK